MGVLQLKATVSLDPHTSRQGHCSPTPPGLALCALSPPLSNFPAFQGELSKQYPSGFPEGFLSLELRVLQDS